MRLALPLRSRRARAITAAAVVIAASVIVPMAWGAAPSHDPVGSLDYAKQIPNGIEIIGGALDRDSTNPISVRVTLDGKALGTLVADQALHSGHGYVGVFGPTPGTHTYCATAINVGPGANVVLGCKTQTYNYNPTGSLDYAQQVPNGIEIIGGAADPDATTPLSVQLTLDGKALGTLVANQAVHSGHGYVGRFGPTPGTHTYCAVAVNQGTGSNTQLGCKTETYDYDPVGSLDWAREEPNGIQVVGGALDPDSTAPVSVRITEDGTLLGTLVADAAPHGQHGYIGSYPAAVGSHTFCATAINIGTGSDTQLGCTTTDYTYGPAGSLDWVRQTPNGIQVVGGARDPDSTAPVTVQVTENGTLLGSLKADAAPHSDHGYIGNFAAAVGPHTFCVTAINIGPGSNTSLGCTTTNFNYNPVGIAPSLARSGTSTNLVVTGWALDPDTTKPISVSISVDGATPTSATAGQPRTDVTAKYPTEGANHGYSVVLSANTNEHKVCVTAINVLAGSGNTAVGCTIIDAVHPVPPGGPTAVAATAGFGGAVVTWTAPTSDGGAPWTGYTVTSSPGGLSVTVGATSTSATIMGLSPSTKYRFTVRTNNIAGSSAAVASPVVTTQAQPPAQTTPAPISTSRYVRNITGSSTATLNQMRAEGAADAKANPSGHGYIVLLDIGGQDQADAGVVLSAGVRFVSNADLVKDLDAYVDGYHSAQRPSAPVMIAIGTNNDMDVNAATGATWASAVVNPIASHAASYLGLSIAGANDIEPGFSSTYAQTASWLSGYLGATRAPFVFNGSADGCSWTATNGHCNNGWTAAGLYNLSAGAAPTRMISLPQIYNDTMAQQWKYISLTGVAAKHPKVDFGGALTEWTACSQAGSCSSLTGQSAWSQLWSQLRSSSALMPATLPYSTDLRIDS